MSTIIDKRGNFTIVENELIHNYDLTPYEGWLYIVLLSHVNRQTGVAFPGYGRLAMLSGMSRSKVRVTIAALIEKGLIVKKNNFDGKEYDSNEYSFLSLRVGHDKAQGMPQENIGVYHHKPQGMPQENIGVPPQGTKPDSLTKLNNQSEITRGITPAESPLKRKLQERGASWQK